MRAEVPGTLRTSACMGAARPCHLNFHLDMGAEAKIWPPVTPPECPTAASPGA